MTASSNSATEKGTSFSFRTLRFAFAGSDELFGVPDQLSNTLRGAFGTVLRRIACECDGPETAPRRHRVNCAYARIFEPERRSENGPSGFANSPRPFVLRPRVTAERGRLTVDVHLFDLDEQLPPYFVRTFFELAREGIGPARSPLSLTSAEVGLPVRLSLCQREAALTRARVEFRTPTELKSQGVSLRDVPFRILFARARDRISALSFLYAEVQLDFDFRAMGKRAEEVRALRQDLDWRRIERRSSRTSQRHGIGGFTGWAEYEGDLREFLPWLEVGYWTGVGRQTLWGKGEILCHF